MADTKSMSRWRKKQTSDEFYTRREDIDAMLPEWDLSDKIVYCPADSDESEFVKYFKQPGKCKELIYTSDDFRTHRDLIEKCDVVVTNPPFSLIRVLYKICENPEEAPIYSEYNGEPVRKYGKRTGFPPKDFKGWFIVTSDNNCSDFIYMGSSALGHPKGFKNHVLTLGGIVKWRNN